MMKKYSQTLTEYVLDKKSRLRKWKDAGNLGTRGKTSNKVYFFSQQEETDSVTASSPSLL